MEHDYSWIYHRNNDNRMGIREEFVEGVKRFVEHAKTLDLWTRFRVIRCPCVRCDGINLFSDYFEEFKNYYLEEAFFLEHELGFEKWSREYFPDNRYNMITINIAESINSLLIVERKYPVASIFNSIAKRFGEKFRESHAYVLNYKDNKFMPLPLKKSKYDLVKIPCTHAMSAFRSKHGDDYSLSIYEYSLPVYKVEEYLLVYLELINVVPLEFEWRMPQELLDRNIISPLVATKLGRKKRKRVKRVGEAFKTKRRNKCSLFKRPGHKRTTCNNKKS
ncbi:hypothetical protein T459_11976 [Capsicum annuum]|uniref:Transposase-associated domain-containing protein n=1 Tax=Capsicum annuum TaxID=4072 RepID=A0A2G2ZNI0_CAPAN|nr:hypothetical protein T459_11976 [Capsicum annuum]